jgi:hypothetical protein
MLHVHADFSSIVPARATAVMNSGHRFIRHNAVRAQLTMRQATFL